MTTLYKKDSKDKIRVLNIFTEGADLVQTAGLLDGNLVTNRKTCKPKNVGKSNESTGEQQALLELASKVTEKLKEDYFMTQHEAETVSVVLPMLAHSYDDHSKKIVWSAGNVFVQPKLDGQRALGVTGPNASLTSRTGSPIDTMPHIIEALKKLPEGFTLDGELYAHGLSFQENMKLIKKNRGADSEQVIYHVYDQVSDKYFNSRIAMLFVMLDAKHTSVITPVFTQIVTCFKDVQQMHAKNIADGYEGSIIRWGNVAYKVNGRSENLLKYKDFKDMALTIVDVIPSEQRPEWGQPVFELNGKRFSSGMRYSHEERKHWLSNKEDYIGKTAELRFFEFTDEGLPRFPVTVGIRLDK